LQRLDFAIRSGRFAVQPFDESLLLKLHAELTKELFPDQAGRYRNMQNQIRGHEPPAPHIVPQRMRDFSRDIAARIEHLSGEADEVLLELLAYAEGELLSIHPFPDLNGRVSRLWILELLRRLHLPTVVLVPTGEAFRMRYFDALAAADRRDWSPLMAIWKERLPTFRLHTHTTSIVPQGPGRSQASRGSGSRRWRRSGRRGFLARRCLRTADSAHNRGTTKLLSGELSTDTTGCSVERREWLLSEGQYRWHPCPR
jgi:fido (protein-threonine AMPylation protein)